MIRVPMDVLKQFPIRKSKKQKMAFRASVGAYVTSLGYAYSEEKCTFGGRNLIFGDPKTAKYLITAHYDTCAALPFPNLITPCNLPLFILYQLLQVVIILAMGSVAILVGAATGVLFNNPAVASTVSYFLYWAMLLVLFIGPANRHNANDNTSGVVTALEIARSLPEAYREHVCFVLFDLEEVGLLGSGSYRGGHKQETNCQVVLNLDCVGDGNDILCFPTKKIIKDTDKLQWLKDGCATWGEKTVRVKETGFSVYPSDQANFPLGVGIAAFQKTKKGVLYLSRIHTKADTVLEETNVNILRDYISALISAAVNEERICNNEAL